jgi:hypothetical protein
MKKILILIPFLFFGCDKKDDSDKDDFRKQYTGLFNFTTTKSNVCMCYDLSLDCINGWRNTILSTKTTTSNIALYDTNKLAIKFGNDTLGKADNVFITQTMYPVVSFDGVLSQTNYPLGGRNLFQGYFVGLDTIIIKIELGLNGMYDKYEVKGIRKK